MSVLLYRLAIGLYHLGIRIAALFNAKAASWVRGRHAWKKQLKDWRKTIPKGAQVLWMHCASLGEFEQGRPVLERMRTEWPELKIVLSFYSPSGYEQRKNYPAADYVCYLPPDGPLRARNWIATLRPDLIVFVKYEFWYYHLKAVFRRRIPTYLIAGVFRPKQLFFQWYGATFRRLLASFTHLYVQTSADLEQLQQVGIENATVAGDPRVDQVLTLAETEEQFPMIDTFAEGHQLLIAGSTWPPGEAILLADRERWSGEWKLLIAPHDIAEAHVKQICEACPVPVLRYSSQPSESDLRKARILVLDTIGMLSRVYRCGDLAYIGGGFGRSIHNTLEPAAHGLPVIFGPKHEKFFEAVQLREMGGGFVVRNEADFEQIFTELKSKSSREAASAQVALYLKRNRGAASRIAGALSHRLRQE